MLSAVTQFTVSIGKATQGTLPGTAIKEQSAVPVNTLPAAGSGPSAWSRYPEGVVTW